jgi:hypothetical protein
LGHTTEEVQAVTQQQDITQMQGVTRKQGGIQMQGVAQQQDFKQVQGVEQFWDSSPLRSVCLQIAMRLGAVTDGLLASATEKLTDASLMLVEVFMPTLVQLSSGEHLYQTALEVKLAQAAVAVWTLPEVPGECGNCCVGPKPYIQNPKNPTSRAPKTLHPEPQKHYIQSPKNPTSRTLKTLHPETLKSLHPKP